MGSPYGEQKPLVMGHLERGLQALRLKTIPPNRMVKLRFLLYPQMNYQVSQLLKGSKPLGVAPKYSTASRFALPLKIVNFPMHHGVIKNTQTLNQI